jgi:ATP-dependent phosphoenolpyruvate carboxykinase
MSMSMVLYLRCRTFLLNRERAVDYLNMLDRIYVFDGFAGWDPEVRECPMLLMLTNAISMLRLRGP